MTEFVDAGLCYTCKTPMMIPRELKEAALRARGPNGIHFFCAYGHSQHYAWGESELEKMRRERDRLAQQIAERNDALKIARDAREHAENQLRGTRGALTRIKNRVAHGVCPCCKRTFGDLARHMASQHPTYVEAAE